MNLNEHLEAVQRTMKHDRLPEDHPELRETWGLGLIGESGEVADLVKKWQGHGHAMDRQKLMNELGDVCWYATALAYTFFREDGVAALWARPVAEYMRVRLPLACSILMQNASGVTAFVLQMPNQLTPDFIGELGCRIRAVGAMAPEPFGIEQAWEANKQKLLKRYPNGFKAADSINRDPEVTK